MAKENERPNVLEVMNTFWDSFPGSSLKIGEAGLYMYILDRWNSHFRPKDWFEIDYTTIIQDTGLHHVTLRKYLSALKSAGFIKYQPGKWRSEKSKFLVLAKGYKNVSLSTKERGVKIHPFDQEKGYKSVGLSDSERGTKVQGFSEKKGYKSDSIKEQRLYTEKKTPKSGIWGECLDLSLLFHQKQKSDGLHHQDFKQKISEKTPVVVNGADTLEKLHRIEGESLKDIKAVLRFILKDSGNGTWTGWKNQVISLASLRTKGKSGTYKYFTVKNAMEKQKASKQPEPEPEAVTPSGYYGESGIWIPDK